MMLKSGDTCTVSKKHNEMSQMIDGGVDEKIFNIFCHFCLLGRRDLFSTLSRHICTTKMQWQITAPAHNLDDKNLIPMNEDER